MMAYDFDVYDPKAKANIGGLVVKTPFLTRMNVSRSRGDNAKASVTFLLPKEENRDGNIDDLDGGPVVLWLDGIVIFTGVTRKVSITPSYQCAGEVIITVSAEDLMFKLSNQRFTRRQRLSPLAPLAMISSIHERVSLGYDDPPSRHDVERTGSDMMIFTHSINMAEHNQMLKGGETNTIGALHPITKVADPIVDGGRSGTGGEGMTYHDHASMDLPSGAGPAKAVFSTR